MSKHVLIETNTPEDLEEVYDQLKEKGMKREDYQIYIPYASHRLFEKLRPDVHSLAPGLVSASGAILGFLIAATFQLYPNLYSYPLRVGGHAHFSWHAFLVICIEMTILFGVLALLLHLCINLRRRSKGSSLIVEECPSQKFSIKIKNVRPEFQNKLEQIKKDFRSIPVESPSSEEES